MQIFVVIVGLFFLLPGLCGAVFLPMGLMDGGDYAVIVYWFSGVGLVFGAAGIALLYFSRRAVPAEARPKGWPLAGYLVGGVIGAALAFQGLSAVLSLPSVVFVLGAGLTAGDFGALVVMIVQIILGAGGAWLVYVVARRLSGQSPAK